MKKCLIVSLLFLLVLSLIVSCISKDKSPSQKEEEVAEKRGKIFSKTQNKLVGSYDIKGINPNGAKYKGKLTIRKVIDAYEVKWQVGEGSYDGTGLVDGDILSVAFANDDRTMFGIVVYKISTKEWLNGVWVIHPDNKTGTEICYKSDVTPPTENYKLISPSQPVEGTYKISGTSPAVESTIKYSGTVSVIKKGKVYDVNWSIGEAENYIGVGLANNDLFAVAYAAPQPPGFGIVTYTIEADGKLTGRWTAHKAGGVLGTEVWKKQ